MYLWRQKLRNIGWESDVVLTKCGKWAGKGHFRWLFNLSWSCFLAGWMNLSNKWKCGKNAAQRATWAGISSFCDPCLLAGWMQAGIPQVQISLNSQKTQEEATASTMVVDAEHQGSHIGLRTNALWSGSASKSKDSLGEIVTSFASVSTHGLQKRMSRTYWWR